MKIIKAGKVLTSEALNAEIITEENNRKINETNRQTNTATAISNCETATENAIVATTNTITATTNANNATNIAIEAAENAQTTAETLETTYAPRLTTVESGMAQIPNQINSAVDPKADKTYVDTKTQANNLSYKESYDTLALLQAAYPTGDTFNHVVLADGMIYTYKSDWVSTQVQANGTGVANKTLTPIKTTYFDKKSNNLQLFDKEEITTGYYIDPIDGVKKANAAYFYGESIDCMPNKQCGLFPTGMGGFIAFYDANGTWLSGTYVNQTINSVVYPAYFTTPADCYTFIISSYTNSIDTIIVQEGKINTADVAYIKSLSLIYDDIIYDKYLEPTNGNNQLLDAGNAIDGKYVDSSDGKQKVNASWFHSRYIPCLPNTDYNHYPAQGFIVFFDDKHQYISGTYTNCTIESVVYGQVFTTPASCYYYIISSFLNVKWQQMVQKGETYTGLVTYEKGLQSKSGYRFLYQPLPRNTFIVSKDGCGDYTSLWAAIQNVPENSTIILYEGVYDETIASWAKTINVIGVDRDKCIIKNTNGNYTTPPLEIGSGYIANVTIYTEDDGTVPTEETYSYAIHIETNYSANKSLTFENCLIKSDWNYCVGAGLRTGFKLKFKDCDFYASRANMGCLFFHDSDDAGYYGTADIITDNCNLITEDGTYVIKVGALHAENTTNITFRRNICWSKVNQVNNALNTYNGDEQTYTGWRNLLNMHLTFDSHGNNFSDMNYVMS